ncbi:ABC transporter substrate-binding protein [Alkalinema sp. FACHB-956]|uniref:ABC transporter substrate-binding protein n=1 Tax=Alkalinema sp. FACHB-956 TaxID=2692768 RepID=UPI0016891D64|nr:ABC transporter substrate-binding protein [Alkalinema sp. FACHB-956]MBD2329400.1 ABC transporter substrate-binding protein [Alkalinema sp. FACHB-956]
MVSFPRTLGLGLGSGLLALMLCGCNPHRWAKESESTLRLLTPIDPKTFNYANSASVPNIFLFSHEGLTRENGMTGAVEPALAEKWEFSPDKKKVVFTLRPGLRWSDGQPLTAADVVFTYNEIVFNEKVPIESKDQIRIGAKGEFPNVRQLDDRRVEFTFPEPFSPFLHTTTGGRTGSVAILPKHKLERSLKEVDQKGNPKFLNTWGTDTNPKDVVVSGPYMLESYTTGQRVIFRRNPYYWRKGAQGETLPKIEKIIWKVIENQDLQLLKFRSGDLDVMGDARPLKAEYYALLKREEQRGNFRLMDGGPWSGVLQFVFNLSTAKNKDGKPFVDPKKSRWFNNKLFRQAVAYSIDKERINNNIFRGLGVVQHSPVSVQSPFYLSPQQGLKTYAHNPAKAKELLQQAGFRYNAQGELFDDRGNRVEFELITNANNLVRVAIAAQVQQDLNKIGMKVNFQAINFNVLVDKINSSRDWDTHMVGFEGGVEPHLVANLWMSSGGSHSFNLKQQPGQPPIQDYAPKPFEVEIDRLFREGAREFDLEKRKKIYGQFQQLVQEELPIIHLVNDRALMAVRNPVQGLQYNGLPFWGLWNIDELYLTQSR